MAVWWLLALRVVRRPLGEAKGVTYLGGGGVEVKGRVMVMVLVVVVVGGVGRVYFEGE